jgi:hypothetical protein
MTTYRDAPLDRGLIDLALPWLRAVCGIAFVAYSSVQTIYFGATDIMWLFPHTNGMTIGYVQDAYWYAGAMAAMFFFGEVATAERYPRVYRGILLPDAFYSARALYWGLSSALGVLLTSMVPGEGDARTGVAKILGYVLAAPIALFFGYIIAKWGEILLFGKRRKLSRSSAKA